MKKHFYLACALLAGCAGDGGMVPPPIDPGDIIGGGGGFLVPSTQTVLGDRLENPYSVANMRKALESLAPEDRGGLSIEDISTSHFYVKFRPANYDELDRIKQDTTLILYDIPLDYEITSQGDHYQDPEVPDSLPTYQYASVEFAHRAAIDTLGVAYDVLENLFIPDEDRDFVENSGTRAAASGVGRIDEAVADALVARSFELTGNAEEPDGMTRASKWRPAGQIRYKSTELGWIGLEGIKVKARRWFTTHTGITNANGYYSCNGRFKRPANYHFDWERYHFEIRRSALGKAKYDGPKKTGNWNVDIDNTQKQAYFRATIFRAAYHYYYKKIQGLSRPPLNSTWKTQLKIRAFYETDGSNGNFNASRRFLGFGSAIHIYNPQNSEQEIYSTTIHELSHAAHWAKYKSDYRNADDFVKESWARGVQTYLTKMVYPTYRISYTLKAYTGIVNDLIDEANVTKECQYYYVKIGGEWNLKSYNSPKKYVDRVTGYTLSQIELSLNGARNATQWKNNLKNRFENETERHLDAAFTYWVD